MDLENNFLYKTSFESPLGEMLVIGNEKGLYLVEFQERLGLQRELEHLKKSLQTEIIEGACASTNSIQEELKKYFRGDLKEFQTPVVLIGTPFQKRVWEGLADIPFGETRSYADVSKALGKPTAYRAVAQANGCNQLALIIPCHRVINSNGALGGYAGGLHRKEWLLRHERV